MLKKIFKFHFRWMLVGLFIGTFMPTIHVLGTWVLTRFLMSNILMGIAYWFLIVNRFKPKELKQPSKIFRSWIFFLLMGLTSGVLANGFYGFLDVITCTPEDALLLNLVAMIINILCGLIFFAILDFIRVTIYVLEKNDIDNDDYLKP